MHNYKTLAKHWEHKLNRTEAWQQSLATYRFKKWKDYDALAIEDAKKHFDEADGNE